MTAVTTNNALELLADLATGGEILREPIEFSNGTDIYKTNKEWNTGVSEIVGTLNGTEDYTFVSGSDYTTTAPDTIDWSVSGDTPDDGTKFYVTYDRPDFSVKSISVGSGTAPVSKSDESMQTELYSTTPDAKFATDSADDGERVYTIEVTGGTEIPAGSGISEFGLFDSNDNMLYHETRDTITVSQGVTQEFRVLFDINS